jgi:hypothetical protein
MTPEGEARRDKVLQLMQTYVDLGDDLPAVESLAELDRIMAEMAAVQAQIDALMAEQERADRIN